MKKPNVWPNRKRRSDTTTLSDWLAKANRKLHKILPEEPSSTLRALLAFVTHQPGHYALSHPDVRLTCQQKDRLDTLFSELLNGKPLPYLIGKQTFFGLDFFVTPDVLIPRPETELLVSAALEFLKPRPKGLIVADVGTGSGCIAISVSCHFPSARIIASDISYTAIRIAQTNAQQLLHNNPIQFVVADLLNGIQTRFDCICANLPYIPSGRLKRLPVSRYEPAGALDGGSGGFSILSRFLPQAIERIKPGGALFLEIDHTHTSFITQLAENLVPQPSIIILKDLTGQDRTAVISTQLE